MAHIHTIIENLRFNKLFGGSELMINTSYGKVLESYFYANKLYANDFFEILFFKKGSGAIWINDKKIEITDNSVIFLSPGQRHCYHLNIGPEDFRCVVFKEDFLLNVLTDKYFLFKLHFYYQSYNPPFMIIDEEHMNKALSVLDEMEAEIAHPQTGVVDVLCSLLIYHLSKLNRLYAGFYDIPAVQSDNNLAVQFKEMLEKDMKDKQTVAGYAKQLGVSRVTLNSAVKAQFGITASELLKNKLIRSIKNELIETNYSVAYISDKYGFSEPNHLMRFFKTRTGQTIGQYLEEYNNSLPHFHDTK